MKSSKNVRRLLAVLAVGAMLASSVFRAVFPRLRPPKK